MECLNGTQGIKMECDNKLANVNRAVRMIFYNGLPPQPVYCNYTCILFNFRYLENSSFKGGKYARKKNG